jgi:hypothetical protein
VTRSDGDKHQCAERQDATDKEQAVAEDLVKADAVRQLGDTEDALCSVAVGVRRDRPGSRLVRVGCRLAKT